MPELPCIITDESEGELNSGLYGAVSSEAALFVGGEEINFSTNRRVYGIQDDSSFGNWDDCMSEGI